MLFSKNQTKIFTVKNDNNNKIKSETKKQDSCMIDPHESFKEHFEHQSKTGPAVAELWSFRNLHPSALISSSQSPPSATTVPGGFVQGSECRDYRRKRQGEKNKNEGVELPAPPSPPSFPPF